MTPDPNQWYRIANPDEVNSPALLVYPERIEENINRMIASVKDKSLLWPHVKTHKMPEVVSMMIRQGIKRFKCATISEAEMAAGCGPDEIFLAYQPVGPNIKRFFMLQEKYHGIAFSCLVDNEEIAQRLSEMSVASGLPVRVWIDINNGMNRTGIAPGQKAVHLFRSLKRLPGLDPRGLHVYDGHLHDSDFTIRKRMSDEAFSTVEAMIDELRAEGHELRIIAGGTPTFNIHAAREGVGVSPGTVSLWDYGYSSSFADLQFLHAAVLFSRVVSKPAEGLVCIDLGTKAVASEMSHPRIKILGMEDYGFLTHNEEHLVISHGKDVQLNIGDILYCIPYHVCPTVDRYNKVYVAENGMVTGEWEVVGRQRKITI